MPRLPFSFMFLGALLAGTLTMAGVGDGVAADATATAGATIENSGVVGPAPEPEPEPEPEQVTETGTSIPTVPISTTSNVGFGGISSAAAAAETAAVEAAVAETTAVRTAARNRLRQTSSSLPGLGPTTSVGVGGAPNQTYSVMLPSSTAFATPSSIVSLSGFTHTAGATPSLNPAGTDVFDVGADMDSEPLSEGQPATGDEDTLSGGESNDTTSPADDIRARVLAQAFAPRAPFVSIVVLYN